MPRALPPAADAHAAIAALVYAYAERLDAGDLAGVAALFADADYGAPQATRRGAAAVEAVLRARVRLYDGVPRTQHVVTNLVVALGADGASATARSCFTVLQAVADLRLQAIVAGRYRDRFRRDAAGAWHFAERLIHVDLVGDVSRHLRD